MEKRMQTLGRVLILQLIMYFAAGLAVIYLCPKEQSSGLAVNILYKAAVFLPPILYYCRRAGYRLTDQPEMNRKMPLSRLLIMYIFGLSLTVTAVNTVGMLTVAVTGAEEGAVTFSGVWDAFSSLVTSVILASITEEILFRGAVFHGTTGQRGVYRVLICSVVFALMHYSVSQFFYAFVAGTIISVFFLKTGSLVFAILLHGGSNLVSWCFMAARSFGDGKAVWIAELVAVAVFAVISVAGLIVFIVRRKKAPVKTDAEECDEAAPTLFIGTELGLYIVLATILSVIR